MKEAADRSEALEKQLAESKASVKALQTEKDTLTAQCETARKELKDALETNIALTEQAKSAVHARSDAEVVKEASREPAQAQLVDTHTQQSAPGGSGNLQEELQRKIRENELLEAARKEDAAKAESLRSRLDTLLRQAQDRNAELDKECAELAAKMKEYLATQHAAEASNREAREKEKDFERQYKEATEMFQTSEQRCRELEKNHMRLDEQNVEAKAKVQELEDELATLRKDAADRASALEQEAGALKASLETTSKELSDMKTRFDQVSRERESLSSECEGLRKQHDSLRKELEAVQSQPVLQNEDKLKSENSQLREDMEALRKRHDEELKQKIGDVQKEAAALKDKLETTSKDLEETRAQCEKLKHEAEQRPVHKSDDVALSLVRAEAEKLREDLVKETERCRAIEIAKVQVETKLSLHDEIKLRDLEIKDREIERLKSALDKKEEEGNSKLLFEMQNALRENKTMAAPSVAALTASYEALDGKARLESELAQHKAACDTLERKLAEAEKELNAMKVHCGCVLVVALR